jgi:ABC-type antimicrobial peptide transport system ATPase subunit
MKEDCFHSLSMFVNDALSGFFVLLAGISDKDIGRLQTIADFIVKHDFEVVELADALSVLEDPLDDATVVHVVESDAPV